MGFLSKGVCRACCYLEFILRSSTCIPAPWWHRRCSGSDYLTSPGDGYSWAALRWIWSLGLDFAINGRKLRSSLQNRVDSPCKPYLPEGTISPQEANGVFAPHVSGTDEGWENPVSLLSLGTSRRSFRIKIWPPDSQAFYDTMEILGSLSPRI